MIENLTQQSDLSNTHSNHPLPVIAQLSVVNNILDRVINAELSGKDDILTGNNSMIIMLIAHREHRKLDTYQSDIEKAFSITRSTASRVIGRMEEKGMINRIPDPHDARRLQLSLTPAARAITRRVRHSGHTIEKAVVQGITGQDLEIFRSVMLTIQKNLLNFTQENAKTSAKSMTKQEGE